MAKTNGLVPTVAWWRRVVVAVIMAQRLGLRINDPLWDDDFKIPILAETASNQRRSRGIHFEQSAFTTG